MCAFVCAHTYSFVVNLYYLYYTSGGQAKDCYFGLSKTISWWWQGHLLHGGSELQHVQRDCTDAWWIRTQALGPVQGQAPWWAFGINLGDILIITLLYYVMRVWFFLVCVWEREVTLTVTESLLECRYMCIDGMWGGGSCEGRRDYLNGAPVKSGRRDCINGTPVRSGKRNCTNGALVRRERRDYKWCTCEKW